MTKYIVEGGLNFFDELNKSLNIEESEENDVQDMCLISNTELTDNYVTLDCNHKFNYEPLYNDILNHKTKYNSLERRQLKVMEIRCPYCRHIQSKLLPQCDGFENRHGVNYIDDYLMTPSGHFSLINGYKLGTCCYESVSTTANSLGNINLNTFNMKDMPDMSSMFNNTTNVTNFNIENWNTVDLTGLSSMFSTSANNTSVVKCTHNYVKLLEEDGKTYCHYHTYFAAKAALKAKKLKEKEDAKIAKEQLKAAAALLKVEKANEKKANMELLKIAKANEKLQKKKTTTTTTQPNMDDNYIITPENVCSQILISGKNKGKMCCGTIHNDNLCKRHYNIQQYVKDVSHIISS